MAPKRSQFEKKFDDYMEDVDDDYDDDDVDDHIISSPHGSAQQLTGFGGLGSSKPASGLGVLGGKPNSGLGGLGSLGGLGGLGNKPSGSRPNSGLGFGKQEQGSSRPSSGLGGGFGGIGKSTGGLGGLGGFGGSSKPSGGLGLLKDNKPSQPSGVLGSKPTGSIQQQGLGKLGLLKEGSKPLEKPEISEQKQASAGPVQDNSQIADVIKKLSDMHMEVYTSVKKTEGENIKTLQSITKFMQELSEKTLNGYREVSEKLNQQRDEQLEVQQSVEQLIVNLDEEIYKSMHDQAYILIPGSETKIITYDEISQLLKDKTIHVYGSVRALADTTNGDKMPELESIPPAETTTEAN